MCSGEMVPGSFGGLGGSRIGGISWFCFRDWHARVCELVVLLGDVVGESRVVGNGEARLIVLVTRVCSSGPGEFRRAFVEACRTGESDSVFIILHSCVWALVVDLVELCLFWKNVWVSWWRAFKRRCLGYGENGEAEAAGVARWLEGG